MFRPGTVMYARAASQINRRNCDCCGAVLTAHQGLSSGICGKPECHDWLIEKVGTELIQRKRRENAEALERAFARMAPEVERAAAAIGATPATVVRSKIPHWSAPVVPLPEARRAAFEKHVRWIVARAFSEAPPQGDSDWREAIEHDEPALMSVACGACRGGCCELGGDTGFLHDVDVLRWRRRDPEATPDEIVDWYLDRLPEETTEGGCVFQGAQGCVLPRDKRNDQCNAFYCASLKALQAEIARTGNDRVVLIADEDGEPRRVVGWSPATGAVPVGPAPAPAPAAPEPIVFSSDDFR